jgi:hypothetical protein
VIISWDGQGQLQHADVITGPWSDVDGAVSPYAVPTGLPGKFYRVKL